jgi:hypothetical protein
MGENVVGISKTRNFCEIIQEMWDQYMPLMALKMMYSLKKVKVWIVTMTAIVAMKILGDSMTIRNFILHCHFVFEFQM